jgi:hypothetical protein
MYIQQIRTSCTASFIISNKLIITLLLLNIYLQYTSCKCLSSFGAPSGEQKGFRITDELCLIWISLSIIRFLPKIHTTSNFSPKITDYLSLRNEMNLFSTPPLLKFSLKLRNSTNFITFTKIAALFCIYVIYLEALDFVLHQTTTCKGHFVNVRFKLKNDN